MIDSEERYTRIVRELADAAAAGLRWIPTKTNSLDGASNPVRNRLDKALKDFDREQWARGLRRDGAEIGEESK